MNKVESRYLELGGFESRAGLSRTEVDSLETFNTYISFYHGLSQTRLWYIGKDGHGHADKDTRTRTDGQLFADSFLRTVFCGQFLADSFLRKVSCGQFFADSFLRTVFCGQFLADSFLRTVSCG